MRSFWSLSFFIISCIVSYGQTEEVSVFAKKNEKKVSLHSWSYPSLPNGDAHSYFDLDYILDSQLQLELRGFYNTYIMSDVSKFDFTVKRYVDNKIYVFSGLGLAKEVAKYGMKSQEVIFNYSYGVGVDVSESIFLEAKQETQINTNVQGINTLPKIFTLSGKYKF
ncbi:hypothetical protein [uncultured Maribacter sp.]|uniref:hypothetical protein n=1 Tax=uncultured Maribacter sp. TaxID=431308 RepID=UPI00261263BC|nr:hypothetical protein [uncultured Maribacter sp.]